MDRRAAKQAYKQTPRPMGVYRVTDRVTGRWIVGASADLPAALNGQRAQLRLGVHPDRALQDAWAARGPDAFAFEELDRLPPPSDPSADPKADLQTLATLWRERLSTWPASKEAGGSFPPPVPPGSRPGPH